MTTKQNKTATEGTEGKPEATEKYALVWHGPLETHVDVISRERVNYLLKAANSRRDNNVIETSSGYRIKDCGLTIDLISQSPSDQPQGTEGKPWQECPDCGAYCADPEAFEQRVLAALKDAAKLVNDCEHDCDYYISDEALLRREAIESAIAAAEKGEQMVIVGGTPPSDQPHKPQESARPDRTWWTYWQYNDEIKKLEAQRDALLAALKDCQTAFGALGYSQPAKHATKRFLAINEIARAAIASVEMEQWETDAERNQ